MDCPAKRGSPFLCPPHPKIWFFTESWGKSSLGARLRTRKVTARDASLPAPLLSAFGILVARGTVGALPQTPQGPLSLDPARGRRKGTKSPLDPFSRLSWSHFHAPSACSFLVLRLSPCLLPQLSVKNRKFSSAAQNRLQNRRFYAILFCACRNGGMADATDSKSVGSDVVWVQVPLPARHEESESDFPIGSGFGFFLAFPSGNTVIIRRSIC